MNPARYIAPIGSIAVLVLIAALPWGLPANDRFFLPFLPVIAIHYWTLRHDAWIPEWVVFVAGLALDILSQGPLGYWAFIYLMAHLMATASSAVAARGTAVRFTLLAIALFLLAFLGWAVASIYFLEFVDWRPYAIGGALAAMCAVVILPVLRVLDVTAAKRGSSMFARGA